MNCKVIKTIKKISEENIENELKELVTITENINLKDNDNLLFINKTIEYLNKYLSEKDKQDLSNYMYCITKKLKGDGAGLSSGIFIDMLLCEFFTKKMDKCEEYHNGECDIKINDINYSLKKINGKSSLALDWSKNPETSIKRETFTHNIILINTKTIQWWKNNPKNKDTNDKTDYTTEIKSGIYIINKDYCKKNIKLSSNNKSNSIIIDTQVYKMIIDSIEKKSFIIIPKPNKELKFSLIKCFE